MISERTKMVKLRVWTGGEFALVCVTWELVPGSAHHSDRHAPITCCDRAGESSYLLETVLKCTFSFMRSVRSGNSLKTISNTILSWDGNSSERHHESFLLITVTISLINFTWAVWCPNCSWWANGLPQKGLLRKSHFHTSSFFVLLKKQIYYCPCFICFKHIIVHVCS